MTPKLGTEVSVRVRNALADFRFLYASNVVPEFLTFTGTVVPNEKWLTNHLSITTGNKSFPVRSIDMSRIVSINGTKTKILESPKSRTWLVKGSKGNSTYTVTEENGLRRCTCVGYQFRHQCKHLNMVK